MATGATTSSGAGPREGLHLTEERLRGGAIRLRLAGTLDLATGEHLRAAAQGGRFAQCTCFEIDLTSVGFVDCAGMRAFSELVRSIEDAGGCVVVLPGAAVARLVRLGGVCRDLVFV